MPGINVVDSKSLQSFDTRIRRCHVIHDGIERWTVCVLEQIAAKQVAIGRQYSY